MVQLQSVTLQPGTQPVLNAGATQMSGNSPHGYGYGAIVSNSAVPPSCPTLGMRQSLCPAKFEALSCTSQSQIVPYPEVLHVPASHCEQPSASPDDALQALAAAAFGWQRRPLFVHVPAHLCLLVN